MAGSACEDKEAGGTLERDLSSKPEDFDIEEIYGKALFFSVRDCTLKRDKCHKFIQINV